ncbi:MAG: hypothetical protein WCA29_00965 [Jiangellales bacterium]
MSAPATDPTTTPTRPLTRRTRLGRAVVVTLAVVGAVTVVALIVGTVVGARAADRTNGGYTYPYQGWTGTPTEYASWYLTDDGLFWPGPIVDQALNCTSGQLTLHVFGLADIQFRPLSDRAKVVHQPQMACRDRGFDTSAWDAIDDPDNLYPDL